MAALRGLVLDRLRLALGGAFRYRGVTVYHPGVLVDQERFGAAVDEVARAVARHGAKPSQVDALLARVDVRILPERPAARGPRVDLHAEWRGGLRDRGAIWLCWSREWPFIFARALYALLLMEVDPTAVPDFAPGASVKDEAGG